METPCTARPVLFLKVNNKRIVIIAKNRDIAQYHFITALGVIHYQTASQLDAFQSHCLENRRVVCERDDLECCNGPKAASQT